jgi:dihydrofolate synthase/folylpolyglutamate synthase
MMNYSEAIQFLYELRLFGLRFGLDNTRHLAALAGHPEDKLRFIHVAGTNGKGSTCAMLENIYRAAGLRVGLFTSPHLVSFAERIQVNRQWIAPEDVARLVGEMRNATVFSGCGELSPTFFEAVTVLALRYFAEQRCDVVIWETGLGGRLDATNIVTPLASVITNVQLDHQQWLGNTLPEIAREKAGIIKGTIPVITGAEDADALQVIAETARQKRAPLSVVTPSDARAMPYQIALAGEHQRMNAAVTVRTAQVLTGRIPVSETALRRGLKETQWAGRCQVVQRANGQTVLLDGAHNPAGAQTLAGAWQGQFAARKGALILGIMRDKDREAICRILAPLARRIFLAPIGSERSADPRLLVEHCRRANPAAAITVCRDLAQAFANAGDEPFVVVTGSLYFVGEALEWLGLVPPSQERALNEYTGAPGRMAAFDPAETLDELAAPPAANARAGLMPVNSFDPGGPGQ